MSLGTQQITPEINPEINPANPIDAGQGDLNARQENATKEKRSVLPYVVSALAIVAIGGGAYYFFFRKDTLPPPRQIREITVIKIIPPPPPPPPPPQQMPEQKMIAQPKMVTPEVKQEKPIEKPKDEPVKEAKNDEPPAPLALDAKPEGPGDVFDLAGHPGGSPFGGGGGGGGSRWGWYASIVQAQIETALHANDKTRNAVMQVEIRLWADSAGRVSRVQLMSSTGNPELDAVIRNDVLGGLTLREAPPKDMPMPIVARITERRPG